MRILFLSPTGRYGGAEASLLDVVDSLRSLEPTWTLRVIAASEGAFVDRLRGLGIEVDVLPFPNVLARVGEREAALWRLGLGLGRAAFATVRYRLALARAIAAFAPDVIHSNGLKMHVLAAWASTRPLVWHLHDYLDGRRVTAALLQWNQRRCARVVANSGSVASDAVRALGGGTPVVTIWNAVDLARFSPCGERLDLDAAAGLPPVSPGTLRVGLVASLGRWKGHTTFLRALALVRHDRPDLDVRGYVVGDAVYDTAGSQYSIEELRALSEALGLRDRVGFTGFASRPDAVFRGLDVVVHASTAPEPFGLVIAEAMACGRALVVSAAGGAAELVTPGVDAVVHAPADAIELASQLVRLAENGELRGRLGQAARQTAERSFDRARLGPEFASLYSAVVEASR